MTKTTRTGTFVASPLQQEDTEGHQSYCRPAAPPYLLFQKMPGKKRLQYVADRSGWDSKTHICDREQRQKREK